MSYFFPPDWISKRDALAVQLVDFPQLVKDYKEAPRRPYPANPIITLVDRVPELRLLNACEATTNALYGMAEITAKYAARASKNHFPRSFNQLRKNASKKLYTEAITTALGETKWYEKVREMRTEWSHFSTAFIGVDGDAPVIVVRSYRSNADREHLSTEIPVTTCELTEWTRNAISSLERFAAFICRTYTIPSLDLNEIVRVPKFDSNGVTIITAEHRFDSEEIPLGDYLKNLGIIC